MPSSLRFPIPSILKLLLLDLKVDLRHLARRASLSADLFYQEAATVDSREFYQLWQAIDWILKGVDLPGFVTQAVRAEATDPATLACLCSENLNSALLRLQQYERLIAPMELSVDITPEATHVSVDFYGNTAPVPEFLLHVKPIFLAQMARVCTRADISPLRVQYQRLPRDLSAYRAFFQCDVVPGDKTLLSFSAEDAIRPFATQNSAILRSFETSLTRQLEAVGAQSSTADRVHAALITLLPSGNSSIESVAKKLNMSVRTLQRKLQEESVAYQPLLQQTRLELAQYYLTRTEHSLGEISFLLGFKRVSSFSLAFKSWMGITPMAYRQSSVSQGTTAYSMLNY